MYDEVWHVLIWIPFKGAASEKKQLQFKSIRFVQQSDATLRILEYFLQIL